MGVWGVACKPKRMTLPALLAPGTVSFDRNMFSILKRLELGWSVRFGIPEFEASVKAFVWTSLENCTLRWAAVLRLGSLVAASPANSDVAARGASYSLLTLN